MLLTITSNQDSNNLQHDLDQLETWANEWLMDFNLDKSYLLRFTRKKNRIKAAYTLQGRELKEVDAVQYLGVTITHNMDWRRHVDKTAAKGNRMLGFQKGT